MHLSEEIIRALNVLFGDIEHIIQVFGQDGTVKYCSPAVVHITGYTVDEMTGSSLFGWVHPQDAGQLRSFVERFFLQPERPHRGTFMFVLKDGTVKSLDLSLSDGFSSPTIGGMVATFKVAPERKRFESYILKKGQLYNMLTEISKSFVAPDFDNSLESLLGKLGEHVLVDRVYMFYVDEGKRVCRCLYEWRIDAGMQSMRYPNGISMSRLRWIFEQFREDNIVNFTSLDDMPKEAREIQMLFRSQNVLSVLLLPMRVSGELIGFIGYDCLAGYKTWDASDLLSLNIWTQVIASSVNRNRAELAIKESLSINEAIIASTAEGILLTDGSGTIIYCNDVFRRMWNLKRSFSGEPTDAVLKQSLRLIADIDKVNEVLELLEREPAAKLKLTLNLHNHKVVEVISAPQIIDGKVAGRIWNVRDLTDRINSEREEIEKGVAKAQFESLRNQINPHFLFNSLNVLSSLVHIDANLSEKFIDQLARSYRYLLEQKGKELVPLKVEIDFLNSFVFLLKIRFGEKLDVRVNVSARAMELSIAPLTLQLLIENAVKHNIVSIATPLIIDICDNEAAELIVKNSLQLRASHGPSTGFGLKNILKRYELLTERKPAFHVTGQHYVASIPLIA